MYDFAIELNFDMKDQGNKSTRDTTFIKLLKSPAIMASGISTDQLVVSTFQKVLFKSAVLTRSFT